MYCIFSNSREFFILIEEETDKDNEDIHGILDDFDSSGKSHLHSRFPDSDNLGDFDEGKFLEYPERDDFLSFPRKCMENGKYFCKVGLEVHFCTRLIPTNDRIFVLFYRLELLVFAIVVDEYIRSDGIEPGGYLSFFTVVFLQVSQGLEKYLRNDIFRHDRVIDPMENITIQSRKKLFIDMCKIRLCHPMEVMDISIL